MSILDTAKEMVANNPVTAGVVMGAAGALACRSLISYGVRKFQNRSVDKAAAAADSVAKANDAKSATADAPATAAAAS